MKAEFKAVEKCTYIVPDDDPRWAQIFARSPHVTVRYHGPLPPGDVDEICLMFIIRNTYEGGYEEVLYFGNKQDAARWSGKLAEWLSGGVGLRYETIARENPTWTVSKILDWAAHWLKTGDVL